MSEENTVETILLLLVGSDSAPDEEDKVHKEMTLFVFEETEDIINFALNQQTPKALNPIEVLKLAEVLDDYASVEIMQSVGRIFFGKLADENAENALDKLIRSLQKDND